MIGDYAAGRADFPWNRILLGELELIGSNASAGAWPEAVRLANALPLERLISRRLPASAYAEALELVRNSRDLVKVVLEWARDSGRLGDFRRSRCGPRRRVKSSQFFCPGSVHSDSAMAQARG